jgi:hypothetical protein
MRSLYVVSTMLLVVLSFFAAVMLTQGASMAGLTKTGASIQSRSMDSSAMLYEGIGGAWANLPMDQRSSSTMSGYMDPRYMNQSAYAPDMLGYGWGGVVSGQTEGMNKNACMNNAKTGGMGSC